MCLKNITINVFFIIIIIYLLIIQRYSVHNDIKQRKSSKSDSNSWVSKLLYKMYVYIFLFIVFFSGEILLALLKILQMKQSEQKKSQFV